MRKRDRIISAVVLVFFVGCSPSTTEKNKEVIRQLVEIVNTRNFDRLDEIVIPDFVRHCQATPDVHIKSRDEMRQFLQQDLLVFPDSQISLQMIIAEGDMVAGYFTFSATQEGAIGPFPATGKKADVNYLSIMRLEGGKIAEMWVEWDNLAILSQLGHYPPQEKSDE